MIVVGDRKCHYIYPYLFLFWNAFGSCSHLQNNVFFTKSYVNFRFFSSFRRTPTNRDRERANEGHARKLLKCITNALRPLCDFLFLCFSFWYLVCVIFPIHIFFLLLLNSICTDRKVCARGNKTFYCILDLPQKFCVGCRIVCISFKLLLSGYTNKLNAIVSCVFFLSFSLVSMPLFGCY